MTEVWPCTDQFIVLQLFGVYAIGVPNAAVDLGDSNALGTITVKVTHGMQTHVTETLEDEKESININKR